MVAEDKQAFVDALVREHGQRLHQFLAARLRWAAADVPDLVQEVYLRLLRVPSHESIRSPKAYLFTVALHVLHQHKLRQSASPEAVDITEVLPELEARRGESPPANLEVREQVEQFYRALKGLPAQSCAVFVLHRQHGYSREEIAVRLGLTLPTVKKRLAQALVHLRQQFDEMK